MRALYSQKGARMDVQILSDPSVQDFIGTHSDVLNSAMGGAKMSDTMRSRLENSNYVFSGMKTFHELNEAFPSLIDSDGNRKSFESFLNDVRKIDETYNRNYLASEYAFVNGSADMAARWESFDDSDRYLLQYRTAGDDKVRPEHAELEGVTLPKSDSFWDSYYPPNGWGCRCTVVEVRRDKYPETDHDKAMERARNATGKDKKGMFRFNPGKEGRAMPAYNPYTIAKCASCDNSKLLKLAKTNELCQACKLLRTNELGYTEVQTENGKVRVSDGQNSGERKANIRIAVYFANKYGHVIDLLPALPGQKNADAYNHTLGYTQEYKSCKGTPTYNSIDRLIRRAGKQSDSIVIEMNGKFDYGDISRALRDRLNRSLNIKEVTILKVGDKDSTDCTYSRERICSDGFKIKQEDFN